MIPIRQGDGTGLSVPGVSEVRKSEGTVLWSAGAEIPDSPLAQNLLAWYRFEDGDARDYTATLFADSTAYDGTINGATHLSNGGVTDYKNGSNSGAFDFGGSDTISLPAINSLDGLSEFTVMAWVKSDNGGTVRETPVSLSGPNGEEKQELQISLWDSNEYLFSVWDGGSISRSQFLGGTPDTNYHLLTLTFDNGQITGYEDTSKIGDATGAGTNIWDVVGGLVGSRTGNSGDYDGAVDELRIYNKVTSLSEITDIYNATAP